MLKNLEITQNVNYHILKEILHSCTKNEEALKILRQHDFHEILSKKKAKCKTVSEYRIVSTVMERKRNAFCFYFQNGKDGRINPR